MGARRCCRPPRRSRARPPPRCDRRDPRAAAGPDLSAGRRGCDFLQGAQQTPREPQVLPIYFLGLATTSSQEFVASEGSPYSSDPSGRTAALTEGRHGGATKKRLELAL